MVAWMERTGRVELIVLMVFLATGVGATAVLIPSAERPREAVPLVRRAPGTETTRFEASLVDAGSPDVAPRPTEAAATTSERVRTGRPAAVLVPPDIPALVADLADDDVRWNAHRAFYLLRQAGAVAAPYLERGLFSPDLQQRQLCARLLRDLGGEPSERLLEVTAEHYWLWRLRGSRRIYTRNEDADEFMVDNAPRSWPYLQRLLHTPKGMHADVALLLAASKCPHTVEPVCWHLIEHLRDNDIAGDARDSTRALYLYGELARPYLEAALHTADHQARQLIRLILLDLDSPPKTQADLLERQRMHDITEVVYDPAVQWNWPPAPRKVR